MGKLGWAAAIGSFAALAVAGAQAQDKPSAVQQQAAQLVRALGEFPAALPGAARSDGRSDPVEDRRRRVHDQLRALGAEGLPAVAQGLADPDVQVRRSVALFLGVVAGRWFDSSRPSLDIQTCLPALTAALQDGDARVRTLAAQAIGETGPNAVAAVPALLVLLTDPDESSRNGACIGLAGIGPGAIEALPALKQALSDPSQDVRRFAQRAIERIEVKR